MSEISSTQRVVIKLSGRITEISKGRVKGNKPTLDIGDTEIYDAQVSEVESQKDICTSSNVSNSRERVLKYTDLTKRFNTQNKGTKKEKFRMITRFWASLLKPFSEADKKYSELKKNGIEGIEVFSKDIQYHFSDFEYITVRNGFAVGKLKDGDIIQIYTFNDNGELIPLRATSIQEVVVTRINVRSYISENQYSFPALIVITSMWDNLPPMKTKDGKIAKMLDDNDHLKWFYENHPSTSEYEKIIPQVVTEIERFFNECPLVLTSKDLAIRFNKLDNERSAN